MNRPQKIRPRPHVGQRSRTARARSTTNRDNPTGAIGFLTGPFIEEILGGKASKRQHGDLLGPAAAGSLLSMFKLGRLLQLVGLVIPPLAIVSQLSGSISLGKMLQFLLMAVGVFTMGYLLQRYSGGSS